MPDFDVAVTELVIPADPSPLGTFRPAVKVLNLGLHEAIVTGDIRLYAANGSMAFSSGLQQVVVPAGEYRLAYAAGLWTPADAGDYSVLASIASERDDVYSNNTLSGVSVTITGAAAPPTAEHGNEAHDPDFISDGDLDAHAALQAGVHGYDAHGDLGIGGAPDDRAALDIHATTKAFIPPRMTTLQKNQILPPSQGMVVFDTDLAQLYFYDGAAWQPVAGAADHARQHAITDTDDHTSGATPGQVLQADANGLPVDASNTDVQVANVVKQTTPQTLTDQANIAWDLSLGGSAAVTLGGNRTLDNPTNMVAGAKYRLRITQDGTGGRILATGNAYRSPCGVSWATLISAGIGAIDIVEFACDGTHMDCTNLVAALA